MKYTLSIKKVVAASMMALMFAATVAEARSSGGVRSGGFSSSSASRSFSRSTPVAKPKTFVSSKSSSTTIVKQAPTKSAVISKPSGTRIVKTAPARKVVSPIQYKKTVVVRKTVYRPRYNSYGYNRSYDYNNYGGYGGSGFGSNFASSMLGVMSGMYLYNALAGDECAKDAEGSCLVQQAQQAVEGVAQDVQQGATDFGLGGMLPPDAPLMMSPSFYNQQ